MTLRVVLRKEARAEFDDAFDWYEGQAPGLGADFLAEVQGVLSRIGTEPEFYPAVMRGVRRAVVRRFPYSVVYRVEPRQVVVLAIFHGKRDPKIWQDRL